MMEVLLLGPGGVGRRGAERERCEDQNTNMSKNVLVGREWMPDSRGALEGGGSGGERERCAVGYKERQGVKKADGERLEGKGWNEDGAIRVWTGSD